MARWLSLVTLRSEAMAVRCSCTVIRCALRRQARREEQRPLHKPPLRRTVSRQKSIGVGKKLADRPPSMPPVRWASQSPKSCSLPQQQRHIQPRRRHLRRQPQQLLLQPSLWPPSRRPKQIRRRVPNHRLHRRRPARSILDLPRRWPKPVCHRHQAVPRALNRRPHHLLRQRRKPHRHLPLPQP